MNWDWEKLRENQQKFEQKKTGGGGPQMPKPPQVDDLLNKFKDFNSPAIIIIAVVVFLIAVGWTSVFKVEQAELGVIQQFGKYDRTASPGLNFKLPFGIEKVTKVDIQFVYKEEFGFQTVKGNNNYRYSNNSSRQEAALMLTGDLNVAVVPWIVHYRVSDPINFLFKVQDVKAILRDMSEATMRTVVGDRSINEVISKRKEIADAAREMLQKEMDEAQTGISIKSIEMKKTNVPEPVQPSFNEVNQAIQEKEQTIYKAREEYNKAIPLARGEAQRVIKDAEGYAIDRVNRAEGDAAKFISIYNEYKKAKDVTKKRMYLEAMLEIYPKLGAKFIIDADQKNLLPLLNMGDGSVSSKNGFLKRGE